MFIKQIKKLQKSKKERIKNKYIIVEGNIEIKMALKGNYKLHKLYICKKIIKNNINFNKKKIKYINKFLYKKISYRKKTEGIIGIFKKKKKNFKKKLYNNKKKKKIIIILENIEKPGNIGSILRTIEATNIIDFIIFIKKKDIYNPNIIRSSIGCIFISPILILSFKDVIKYLFKKKFYLLGTSIKKKKSTCLYNLNFKKKNICIIFGNEHNGLSNKWKKLINNNINIPMYGKINSLNVSISLSIILYEILRLKNFYKYKNNVK
ncbi:MAG: RNA methyltransferase [Candidatus Shikimatogenerans bostrichidophilus]|nr:MAG: RNA methyltransferase [Candidatus Shikimatogenerans bostrichidophilus]